MGGRRVEKGVPGGMWSFGVAFNVKLGAKIFKK